MMQGAPTAELGSLGVGLEDLAALAEIAEMLKVTKRTAQRYIARDDFPEPAGRIAGGRVWLRADIKAWDERTRTGQPRALPRTGRPRKAAEE